jgi:A/G-specific adenine glycosylase
MTYPVPYTWAVRQIPESDIRSFRTRVLRFYKAQGRDLPWRKTTDPYCITVSEIMLQQTQVERVRDKYLAWLKQWPNWEALSRASDRELLTAWSGLGYNRRALHLGKLAREICSHFGGELPQDPEELLSLSGVGPYTAHAILIFAFNQPLITIDTNIRRVLLHEFKLAATTPKSDLERLALRVLPKKRSRDWHNALMDYSRLVLPKQIKGLPPVSKQSRFQGSLRQIRGEIVRQLTIKEVVTIGRIARLMNRSEAEVTKAASALANDGVVQLSGKTVRLKS